MRETFAATVSEAMDRDPRVAVVLAAISAGMFRSAAARHPGRVVDVGIREQAMIGVAGGLALTGMRPIVHSYAPFLVERPFEQVKLDFAHQDVGAVLVSIGGSYDASEEGRTHQAPGDVALLDTLPGWTVHVPGHADEARAALESAIPGDDRVYVRLSETSNRAPRPVDGRLSAVRTGSPRSAGVVVAVGPMLDRVLEATADLDVTVAHTSTVRPFDRAGLSALVGAAGNADVLVVEPYLAGTSAHEVAAALVDRRHRQLGLGVARDRELRAYGAPAQHARAHGLDAEGIAEAARGFFLV
ncbi:transketolase family protein [Nocardiopsis tropica]|jgi:transketolase|uniref:Transketolase C-terminal domain-containing protein n=1 Tax=Nocardiopsis tropica TaxID=109330 RepID=A0ABU7KM86_9ACTN|nr:transketolase C-terminal domain-containing protein [Nocardiopsis umidischolae]MEE2050402.1 transketolase C-terminal domain-containing protein [Nocardiopsis umidischolae]